MSSPSGAQEVNSAEPNESSLSYGALAEVLANDELRNRLVNELRELAVEAPAEAANVAPTSVAPEPSLATEATEPTESTSRLLLAFQYFAYQLHFDLKDSWAVVNELLNEETAQVEQLQRWRSVLFNLLVVGGITLVAYGLSRRLATIPFQRLDAWAHREVSAHSSVLTRSTRLRKLLAVVAALGVDWLIIAVALLAGYAGMVALTASQTASYTSFLNMQFLMAFGVVEVMKTLSRAVFATRYEQLRLVPLDSATATSWNRWASGLFTLSGYGLLVVVPLLQVLIAPSLANVVETLFAFSVYVYVVSVLWKQRTAVSGAFLKQANQAENSVLGTLLRIMSRLWVWLALLYLTTLLVVLQVEHQDGLGFMAKASVQTLLVILIGAALLLLLNTLGNQRLKLSEYWQRNFPLLEARLNSYVPASLRALRLVVAVGMALAIFDAWRLFDLKEWLFSAQGQAVVNTFVRVALVLVIAALSWTVLASMIEHRLMLAGAKMPTEREKTLLLLFRNALAIVIVTMTALIVLSQIGIDIGPLIAGAGVVGLAVGFGAQKMVQDVITGVFIQLENGMNQNDVVEVAGLFGVVEKLTIRSVVIRTLDGGYHLVPFSSIDCVANHTRDYGYHHGEYLVGLRESVDDVMEHMHAAFADLKQDPEVAEYILEDISIPGVTNLGSTGTTIRVLIKTAPGMQWAVQRSFNRLLKQHFDAAGIEIPYPQTVVHFGRDKEGNSAPANIHMVDAVAHSQRQGKELVQGPESGPAPTGAN